MKKSIIAFASIVILSSCAELQQVVNSLPQQTSGGMGLSNIDIGNGLKQALNNGITKQVSKLTQTDGFYKNQLVKILLPQELQKVDNGLRKIGLGKMADEGIKMLNRAAEDAVKNATPIFVNAIKQMSFTDAKQILLGNKNAATQYLKNKTTASLTRSFTPVIQKSFARVGADRIWSNIIQKYNSIPLTNNVNPNLTDYVTGQALKGVYSMIAIEEGQIRTKLGARTSDLLRRVFALQDR